MATSHETANLKNSFGIDTTILKCTRILNDNNYKGVAQVETILLVQEKMPDKEIHSGLLKKINEVH